jgi:hypothetical protein
MGLLYSRDRTNGYQVVLAGRRFIQNLAYSDKEMLC